MMSMQVARYFKEVLLLPESPFYCAFEHVVFAVHDEDPNAPCAHKRLPCLESFEREICPIGQMLVIHKSGESEMIATGLEEC